MGIFQCVPRRVGLLGTVLVLLFVGDWQGSCPPAHAALSDLERRLKSEKVDLERIGRELEANNGEIRGLVGKEREIGKQIALIEQKISLLQEYLRGLRQEEAELERRIGNAEGSLRRARRRLLRYQRDFSQRLVSIYKRRKLSLMGLLLSPGSSLSDVLVRHRYLRAVAEQDRRDFEKVRREKDRIERLSAQLSSDYVKKLALDEKTSAQEQSLGSVRGSQQGLLAEVRSNIDLRRELARGLEADRRRSQAAIEKIIEAIREQEKRARLQREADRRRGETGRQGVIEGTLDSYGEFASRKGALKWPAKGPVLSRFGKHRDKKLKTWTFNRGIDISAASGTPVKAVAPGKAVMVDWFRGYGKFALLYHGADYFTLYGCLSEVYVRVGTVVDEGDTIARSGDTGTLGQPKLHFEVLEGKDALNPLDWLSLAD